MLKDTFGFEDVSMIDIALIGQDSENNFNGCNCGIMDQFASAMGKKDHAIFLDTKVSFNISPVRTSREAEEDSPEPFGISP